MYAKLMNNQLHYPPTEIEIGGKIVINPTGEQVAQLGYKPVIYAEIDAEDIAPKQAVYSEDETHIYVNYIDAVPETPDPEAQRRAAYEAEADQYILAYNGYLMEGNQSDAAVQLQLYLSKKQEIRNLYPNEII